MKPIVFSALIALSILSDPAQSEPERPVVFLPGILGSKLYKSDDEFYDSGDDLLWGDRASYRRFGELELKSDDGIIPHGVIESVRVLGPIRVRQYKELIDHLENLGYVRDNSLYIFAYDWRKSNFHSAEHLDEFVEECKNPGSGCENLGSGQFDIVAHSMGGIVARIFLDRHPVNGARVKSLVTLGTPYLGSHAAIQTLAEGFSGIAKLMSGDQNDAKRVMLSFESGYELAPTYANCCFLGASWDRSQELALGDAKAWEYFLPEGETYQEWEARFKTGVDRQAQVAAIMDSESSASIYPVAASNIRTIGSLLIDPESGSSSWSYTRGDGTVPILSAANGAIANSRTSMKKHSHIFADRYVEESLRRILVAKNDLIPYANEYTACRSNPTEQCFYVGDVLTKMLNLNITPGVIRILEHSTAIFEIEQDESPSENQTILPRLCIMDANKKQSSCIVDRELRATDSGSPQLRSFASPIIFDSAGDYKAAVFVDNAEIVAEYFTVVGEDE